MMMAEHDIGDAVARLEQVFEDKLRLRRGGFEQRARQARRMLPRGLRADLARVIEAWRMVGHPKQARVLDGPEVLRSAERIETHLKRLDLADRRKGRLLALLASLMFDALLVIAVVLGLLVWRGFV
ncbi:hypothetical protein Q4543_22495 [Salipiger sp. 1_MG-2023]|nr:hypothetical protein [Salipiger sp. 1_MG-2023]